MDAVRKRTPSVQRTAPKRGMLGAGETARAADPPWERGTVLRSDRWKRDRVIEDMQGNEIGLRSGSTLSWVKSVPHDVHRVITETDSADI